MQVNCHNKEGEAKMRSPKMLNAVTVVGILLISVSLVAQVFYPSVVPGEKRLINGVLIENNGKEATMGLTADDLEQLIYGVNEIPGYTVVPNPYNQNHTIIDLDAGGSRKPVKWLRSSIRRWWYREELVQQYRQGLLDFPNLHKSFIRIEVNIYDRPAREYGKTLSEYRWQSSAGIAFKEGTPSGLPLGEESWYLPPTTQFFRLGRGFVIVSAPEIDFAEALAVGIEYFILLHPKRIVMAKQPITVLVGTQLVAKGRAVSLAGVTVAPISSLSSAKVTLQTKREKDEWAVTASLNGRWVRVKAFSWEMETERGKVKLERPVFPYRGELIVPLRQVAEALGIRVEQKGQTIALLPRE